MTEPELQPCTRFEWERIVRRCQIQQQTKLVGFVLAQYGDVHGRGIRPGTDRLAAVCGMSERTVRRHLQVLRDLALILRVRNGGGRGERGPDAAEWRLIVPSDLLERVEMLGPDEGTSVTRMTGAQHPHPVDNPGAPDNMMAGASGPAEPEHRPSVTEHRPSGDRAPATQMTAHQETTQVTPKTLREVSTSPVDKPAERSRADLPDPEAERRRQVADLAAKYPTDETREAS